MSIPVNHALIRDAGRFVKGRSGNPHGRPKRGETVAEQLRKMLSSDMDGVTIREQVAKTLITASLNGDMAAMKLLLERVDGKVPDALEVSGPGGGPQSFTFAFQRPSDADGN